MRYMIIQKIVNINVSENIFSLHGCLNMSILRIKKGIRLFTERMILVIKGKKI